MIYDNRQLADRYRGQYYTHQGDGVLQAAKAIERFPREIHVYYLNTGTINELKIEQPVRDNIEALLSNHR